MVLSGFGLSAFIFSSIAHVAFPGDTPSFLLVLAIGTSLPMILGILFVRPIPPSNLPDHRRLERGQIVSQEESLQDTTPSGIFRRETDARVPLLASQGSDGAPPFPRNEISQSDSVESNFVVPAAEGAVPLSRTTSYTRERGSTFVVSIGSKEAHPDIHGMALVTSVEFWLLFTVTTLCK